MELEATQFNCDFKMNWNTWFYEGITVQFVLIIGITYIRLQEFEQRMNCFLTGDDEQIRAESEGINLSQEITKSKKIDEILSNLTLWQASDQLNPLVIYDESQSIRNSIVRTIAQDFPLFACEEKVNEKEIWIYKHQNKMEKKTQETICKEKANAIKGFIQVFELLIQQKSKIVGQNCLFDLLFIYSHFFEELPQDYLEFKAKLLEIFPE
jgi:hypothetical protein